MKYNENVNLKKYLRERKREFKALEKEVEFLEKHKSPITIKSNWKNELKFFCEDYSLATDVTLEEREVYLEGESEYPYGYWHTIRHEIFPQFYFKLSKGKYETQINLTHEGFDKDGNVVVRGYNKTEGEGDYCHKKEFHENDIDYHKALCFFIEKGVKKDLLENLEKKILEIKEGN